MSPGSTMRRRLLLGLIGGISLLWVVVLVLVYLQAQREVGEVFDADLARSAQVLAALLDHEAREEQEFSVAVQQVLGEIGPDDLERFPHLARILREYAGKGGKERLEFTSMVRGMGQQYESKLGLLARYADGTVMISTAGVPDFPLGASGFFDFRDSAARWRGYGVVNRESGLQVQVGENQAVRAVLARHITRNTGGPALIALPLFGILIWIIVGRSMQPLERLAREVGGRDPDALDPVADTDVPGEVIPLLRSLNDLFGRVDRAREQERRFTADAAHELRTPLAALKTYAQVARRTNDPAQRDQLLAQIGDSVDRSTHLVEQLLALARADAQLPDMVLAQRADLREVAVETLSVFGPQASRRQIELDLESTEQGFPVAGDFHALCVLLRNLVDNAIRYTPAGGMVRVRVFEAAGRNILQVTDSGPGIAPEEREHLLQRFHRGRGVEAQGSGLGLSIVQRIAEVHGAELEIGSGPEGAGCRVQIRFPRRDPTRASAPVGGLRPVLP